jgi:hypothetical protein
MVATSDADAARSEPQAPFYVSNGDLHEALGKPRQPKAGEECQLLPIDAMQYVIQISEGKELSAFAIYLILAFTNLVISCLVLIQMMGS